MAKRLIDPLFTDTAIPKADNERSTFRYRFPNTLSTTFGRLTPLGCWEVLPGDHWKGSAFPFVRLEPLTKPILADVNVFVHFFFVPNRILWEPWPDWIAGLEDGAEAAKPFFLHGVPGDSKQAPFADFFKESSLADYLGVNATYEDMISATATEPIELLPFLAYQSIYEHWYANKNFTAAGAIHEALKYVHDGEYYWDHDDDDSLLVEYLAIRQRDWEPDYFTSALPWPQREDPVRIPFVPVNRDILYKSGVNKSGLIRSSSNDGFYPVEILSVDSSGRLQPRSLSSTKEQLYAQSMYPITNSDGQDTESYTAISDPVSSGANYFYDPNGTLQLDPNMQNFSTIEDLRVARLLQRFREISGNSENDYQGQIEAMFNVRIPDYRCDKPELIGGGRQPVTISSVVSQAETSEAPLGAMAGQALSIPQNCFFEYHAYEHGFIIPIMSVMPRSVYFQGLHRKFSRFDRFDYAWPQFATLGAQEVKNKEIMLAGQYPGNTFGYQPRYMEYKTMSPEIHGRIKSESDYWTISRKFTVGVDPQLGDSFLQLVQGEMDDIFAVNDFSDNIIAQVKFNIESNRELPYFAQPLV